MKITRRELAGGLAGMTVAVAPLLAQEPPATPPVKTPGDELKAARDQLRSNAEQIARVAVPMATEPAVHFKA